MCSVISKIRSQNAKIRSQNSKVLILFFILIFFILGPDFYFIILGWKIRYFLKIRSQKSEIQRSKGIDPIYDYFYDFIRVNFFMIIFTIFLFEEMNWS